MTKIQTIVEFIKIKLLKRGAAHIVIGSFLTKFVSFFGSVFLVRVLSKSDYGVLSYYENFMSYFVILAGFGLASGLQRYIIIADTNQEKKACYNNAIHLSVLWNVGLVIVGIVFFLCYPHPDAFKEYWKIAVILTFCIPFIDLIKINLATLRALFDYKGYAMLAFSTSFGLIVMRVIGAFIGGLSGTVLLRLTCEISCACICCVYVHWKFFKCIRPGKISSSFLKERNIYSVQMMFTNGLWTIFMLNDLFLLGQLIGNEVMIAEYKVAYVIPANLSILTYAVGIFIAPYFTKKEKDGDWRWIKKNIKLVLIVNVGIMAVLSTLCFLLAKPLILLLYGEKYLSSVMIMRLLLIATFFNNGVRATLANILSAMGIQKLNLYVAGGGMALQITFDLLLIPVYGGIGIACSNFIVHFSMSIALATAAFMLVKKKETNKF